MKHPSFIVSTLIIISIVLISGCLKPAEKTEFTGKEVGAEFQKSDQDVEKTPLKTNELSMLDKVKVEPLQTSDIIKTMLGDVQIQTSQDADMEISTSSEKTEGITTTIIVLKFFDPAKLDSFFIQSQSTLLEQGHTFVGRADYAEISNVYTDNKGTTTFILKRSPFLIILTKKPIA